MIIQQLVVNVAGNATNQLSQVQHCLLLKGVQLKGKLMCHVWPQPAAAE